MERAKLDYEELDEIDFLLDHASGNNYEGWENYWTDKEKFKIRIVELVATWKEYCKWYGRK